MQHTKGFASLRGAANETRRRIYYTETQKALMWERWRNRLTGCHNASVRLCRSRAALAVGLVVWPCCTLPIEKPS